MTRTARSGWRHGVSAAAIGLVVLAAPTAVSAADEPVTGSAIVGAAVDPTVWPDPVDAGSVTLLLVAGTLGLLGVLSGPELATPARRPDARPRERAH